MINGQGGKGMADVKATVTIDVENLEEVQQAIRALQEMVEQAYQAVSTIGPSEIRLMSKPVREGLAAFMETAEKVVAELTLARNEEGQGQEHWTCACGETTNRSHWRTGEDGTMYHNAESGHGPGEPMSTFGAPGHELQSLGPDVAGADDGEPVDITGQTVFIDTPPTDDEAKEGSLGSGHLVEQGDFGAGHGAEEWTEVMAHAADARDDPEIMCPQTKDGVPCNRPLHNVGLHTPEGYPENGTSWADKESDD